MPEGYIVGQSVKSDTLVQPGTEIVIYVSKGKQQVVLPSVVGYDYAEAEKRLTELGFKCIKKEIYEAATAITRSSKWRRLPTRPTTSAPRSI